MPELPEVEIIRRGIQREIPQTNISGIDLFRSDLRFPLPVKELKRLKNQKILDVGRRGKFLIIKSTASDFTSHLGMTGHWRFENRYKPIKHDHIAIHWAQKSLIYNDPRRFGYVLNYSEDLFSGFGPDPILDNINHSAFSTRFKKSTVNIKTFLLNQKNILGIGNIYASEILFKCKINPLRPVNTLKPKDWKNVLFYTHEVLSKAIDLGGSSLRDYKNVDGEKGNMQNHWLVYGHADLPCKYCKTKIINTVVSNRSSYHCTKCQK